MPDHDVSPPRAAGLPWVTGIALTLCAANYCAALTAEDLESWDTLTRLGFLPAPAIWGGEYWALLSSVFVHLEAWHVLFNAYWLWRLGRVLEAQLGSLRFLAFYLAAALLSSSAQLAVSGTTGIGASGVVYALFGYLWVAPYGQSHGPAALDTRTIRLFLFWLLGCMVATQLEILSVGNAAHVTGLLFGAAVAGAGGKPRVRGLARSGLAALIAAALAPLFWCPWSTEWLCHRAYAEHDAGRYAKARGWYTRVIERDPENAWAYANRADVLWQLGLTNEANHDLLQAEKLDPSITAEPEADARGTP